MILRIALGIGTIIFGFVIYPYYIDYLIEPIQTLINAMFPSLNVLESAFIDSIPLIVLLMILYFGIMHLIGKVGRSGGEGVE